MTRNRAITYINDIFGLQEDIVSDFIEFRGYNFNNYSDNEILKLAEIYKIIDDNEGKFNGKTYRIFN